MTPLGPRLHLSASSRRFAWYVIVALASWLMISAVALPNSEGQVGNASLNAIFFLFLAAATVTNPKARFLGMALGLETALSAVLVSSASAVTMWNQLLIAAAITGAFLLGKAPEVSLSDGGISWTSTS
jgi:hypothetical protein